MLVWYFHNHQIEGQPDFKSLQNTQLCLLLFVTAWLTCFEDSSSLIQKYYCTQYFNKSIVEYVQVWGTISINSIFWGIVIMYIYLYIPPMFVSYHVFIIKILLMYFLCCSIFIIHYYMFINVVMHLWMSLCIYKCHYIYQCIDPSDLHMHFVLERDVMSLPNSIIS